MDFPQFYTIYGEVRSTLEKIKDYSQDFFFKFQNSFTGTQSIIAREVEEKFQKKKIQKKNKNVLNKFFNKVKPLFDKKSQNERKIIRKKEWEIIYDYFEEIEYKVEQLEGFDFDESKEAEKFYKSLKQLYDQHVTQYDNFVKYFQELIREEIKKLIKFLVDEPGIDLIEDYIHLNEPKFLEKIIFQRSGFFNEFNNNDDLNLDEICIFGNSDITDDILSESSTEFQKTSKSFVLKSVKKKGECLRNADSSLKSDEEIVFEAVKQKGYVLKYASEKLRKKKKFILSLIKRRACILKYVDEKLQKNKEFILSCVKLNGICLKYCKNFEMDDEIIINAVKQNGFSLQFAKKRNKEIVLEAVKQNGIALVFAGDLKDDFDIVIEAALQNRNCLSFGKFELQIEIKKLFDNPNFIKKKQLEIELEKKNKFYENELKKTKKIKDLEEIERLQNQEIKTLEKSIKIENEREIKVFKVRNLLGNSMLKDFKPKKILRKDKFGVVVEIEFKNNSHFRMKCMNNYCQFNTPVINQLIIDVENVEHIPLHKNIIPIYKTFKDNLNDDNKFKKFFKKKKCLDKFSSEKTGFIITPIYQKDLKELCEEIKIERKKPPFFEREEIICFIHQLLEGICFLQEFKIVHR